MNIRSKPFLPSDLKRSGLYDARLRAGVPLFKNHVLGKSFNSTEVLKNDEVVDLVLRAAKTPMGIGSDGAALAATKVVDTAVPITGPSVARELMARGLKVEFGNAAVIAVPGRVCDQDNSSSFVAENSPIPVKVAALTSITLTPCRLPVIAVFSDELAQSSNAVASFPQF